MSYDKVTIYMNCLYFRFSIAVRFVKRFEMLVWTVRPNYRIWGSRLTCVCLQVSDLSSKLREMRQYWIQLPMALCGKVAPVGAGQDKCWNGITKARWERNLLTDQSQSRLKFKCDFKHQLNPSDPFKLPFKSRLWRVLSLLFDSSVSVNCDKCYHIFPVPKVLKFSPIPFNHTNDKGRQKSLHSTSLNGRMFDMFCLKNDWNDK